MTDGRLRVPRAVKRNESTVTPFARKVALDAVVKRDVERSRVRYDESGRRARILGTPSVVVRVFEVGIRSLRIRCSGKLGPGRHHAVLELDVRGREAIGVAVFE